MAYSVDVEVQGTSNLNGHAKEHLDEPEANYCGVFYPLWVPYGVVESPSGQKEIVFAIHYPSATPRKDMKKYVVPNSNTLHIDYLWPRVITNDNLLHWFPLNVVNGEKKIESYHPTIVCFRNFSAHFVQGNQTSSSLHLNYVQVVL